MKTIEIYGQKGCRYCTWAMNYARRFGLAFIYRDIADLRAREEMFRRNPAAKTVPQIFIGDQLIGGYDDLVARPVEEIKQMIGE